jgi:hypothetical protein
MPRWESKSGAGEKFFEFVLDGSRVWRAAGSRAPDATEWSVAHSDPKCFFLANDEAAQADYDKQVSKLPKSAKLVGDETPVITPAREERRKQQEELHKAMVAWEERYGLVAELTAGRKARLVGLKENNKDDYVEVELEGTTVILRRGTGTGRPKTERETLPSVDEALRAAQRQLFGYTALERFGRETR